MANQHTMFTVPTTINEPGAWAGVETEVRATTYGQYAVHQQLAGRPYVYKRTYAITDRFTSTVVAQDFKRQADARRFVYEVLLQK